jgi:hypothetical protein
MIRIFDGTTEIARHRRSFDSGKCISDPAHLDALLSMKRKASGSTALQRLAHSIPNIEEFLQAAADRNEPISKIPRQLILMLSQYGSSEVAAAIKEALEKQSPRISSVVYILNSRHRNKRTKSINVDLSRHPELADVSVPNASLEAYDELNRKDDEDQ